MHLLTFCDVCRHHWFLSDEHWVVPLLVKAACVDLPVVPIPCIRGIFLCLTL
jgi:hypothetical protein